MKKLKLALLSGGVSSEREVSLSSGEEVFKALDKNKYDIVRYDPKTDLKQLVHDAGDIDAALIILHGPYGEDGTIQGMLDLLNIPYQGAGVLGSAIAMNKLLSKQLYRQNHIPTPAYLSFTRNQTIDTDDCVRTLGLPLVIKPTCAGSSVGLTLVRDRRDMEKAIRLAFEHDHTLLMETYVKGIELTCGVLGNDDPKALPVIEIIPGKDHEFFDYHAKYVAGATEEICPARIDDTLTEQVQEYAVRAHKSLFLTGYSRTDMLLADGELFVLETNTIPGMTATSLYPRSARVAGYSFTVLLDELIALSLKKNNTPRRTP